MPSVSLLSVNTDTEKYVILHHSRTPSHIKSLFIREDDDFFVIPVEGPYILVLGEQFVRKPG